MLDVKHDQKIIEFYTTKKLSTRQIAQLYHCSKNTIATHLIKNGVILRNHSESKKLRPNPDKYKVSEAKLRHLYVEKKMSAYQIADFHKCSPSTIFAKLKRFNIPRRSLSESVTLTNARRALHIAQANVRYLKKDFNGSLEEKAYLLGFSLGDLHVSKRPYGVTIRIQCWSTKPEQIRLINKLFEAYGQVNLHSRQHFSGKKQLGITCYLDTSFDFLLHNSDKIPDWIMKDRHTFAAFTAGYIDAEGSFGVDNGWSRFSLSSYQRNIIRQIHEGFNKYTVICPAPYLSVKAGYIDKRGVTTRQDLWTLRVNRQTSIVELYNLVSPYIRHSKRKKDLARAYLVAKENSGRIKR